MPRKDRGYKRGEPHRDATLFIIACEGAVREKEYFEHLGEYTTKIRVRVLENTNGNSAPKWVLDSAARYVEEYKLDDNDQLWFVIDIDRWDPAHIRNIFEACEQNKNWGIALSNPCFEVWLYMHLDDIETSSSKSCRDLKTELSNKIPGGYDKRKFIPMIRNAHERAFRSDKDPAHFLPEIMRTKMHLLTGEIFKLIGQNSKLS